MQKKMQFACELQKDIGLLTFLERPPQKAFHNPTVFKNIFTFFFKKAKDVESLTKEEDLAQLSKNSKKYKPTHGIKPDANLHCGWGVSSSNSSNAEVV